MKITVVLADTFQLNQAPSDVILERETEHVPAPGDIVKVGHNLSGFDSFVVEQRVFRSYAGKMHAGEAFQQVILLVKNVRHAAAERPDAEAEAAPA